MSAPAPGNLVINLISDREPAIAKALRFGRKFLAAGWPVTLSINLEAVVLLAPDSGLGPCPVTGQPLEAILTAYLAEGGGVLVGAECLKLAGLGPHLLRPGMQLAEIGLWQELLARPGTVVFTY